MRQDLSALFDHLAPGYDAWYRTPLGALCHDLEKEAVLALAQVRPGERALDVSCGTGHYALELAGRGARVVGVDPSVGMLAVAQAKAQPAGLAVLLGRADPAHLPFPAESFDLVTAVLMLEFAPSPQAVVDEMVRVLRPGGRLVIGALNKWSLWAFIRRVKALFVPSVWREAAFFSRRDLGRLLSSAGCENPHWRSVIYFPPFNWPWLLDRGRALERIGQRLSPDLGAFLAAGCKKHVPFWRVPNS